MTRTALVWLLMLGSGVAQTLTCTFQFAGSGTVGTHTFTNAEIKVTTIGSIASRQPSGDGGYHINNASASISVAGIGAFQLLAPIPPTGTFTNPSNAAPGTVVSEYFTLGSTFGLSTAMVFGTSPSSTPWTMLNAIGPVSLNVGSIIWTSVVTSGGSLNLYNTSTSIPMTFQATLSGGAPSPVLTRAGVLSHIAAGGGWTTVMTLVNTSSVAVPVTVALHSDDGSAMSLLVTITQQGISQTNNTSSINATLNPNATLLISTGDQIASTVVGWADVLSTAPIGGYAIFRSTPLTASPSEGTVPLQSQSPSILTLPFDNTKGFVMGVALANLSTSSTSIIVTIWDDSGSQLGTQFISIAGSGHTAFALPAQIPLTIGKRGLVTFQSTGGGIAGIGLRFSPFGTFTSVPTV